MVTIIPTVTTVGDKALTESIVDRSIVELQEDAEIKLRESAFYRCKLLKKVVFCEKVTFKNNAFRDCTSLVVADFWVTPDTTYSTQAFSGCSALRALIIRGSAVNVALGSGFLAATPIVSGTGYIYVPAALVDSYKAALNWSDYANQFRALEDYTVDGTTTGALDETKI